MLQWIIGGIAGIWILNTFSQTYLAHQYKKTLEKNKADTTVIRAGTQTATLYTFETKHKALQHPQKISFDVSFPKDAILNMIDPQTKIEYYDGKSFMTISDSTLVTFTNEAEISTFAYIHLAKKET